MNREEVLNTFLLANIPEIITHEEFNDVKKAIKQLQQENKKYKEVIDKAIEYIDDWLFNVGGMGACMDYKDIKEILDILKEVE